MSTLPSVRREQPPAVPGAGVFGTAKVPKEAKKVGKITLRMAALTATPWGFWAAY